MTPTVEPLQTLTSDTDGDSDTDEDSWATSDQGNRDMPIFQIWPEGWVMDEPLPRNYVEVGTLGQ